MRAHAALLALSVKSLVNTREIGVVHIPDLQSTGPAPERIPATVTVRISIFGIPGE